MMDKSRYVGVSHSEKFTLVTAEWNTTNGGAVVKPRIPKAGKPKQPSTEKKEQKKVAPRKKAEPKALKKLPPFGCAKCRRERPTGCVNCNPSLIKVALLKQITKLKEQALSGFEKKVSTLERALAKHCSEVPRHVHTPLRPVLLVKKSNACIRQRCSYRGKTI